MKSMICAMTVVMTLLVGSSFANAAFFLERCGGTQVKAINLNAACNKHEDKTIVSCKKICNKRKGLKCISHSWRLKVTKKCPMKACGTKQLTVTFKNSGKRPISLLWVKRKVVGTSAGLHSPHKLDIDLKPGETRKYTFSSNLKQKCQKRRRLVVLFLCKKTGGKFSMYKRDVSMITTYGGLNFGTIDFKKKTCLGYKTALFEEFNDVMNFIKSK